MLFGASTNFTQNVKVCLFSFRFVVLGFPNVEIGTTLGTIHGHRKSSLPSHNFRKIVIKSFSFHFTYFCRLLIKIGQKGLVPLHTLGENVHFVHKSLSLELSDNWRFFHEDLLCTFAEKDLFWRTLLENQGFMDSIFIVSVIFLSMYCSMYFCCLNRS